MIKRIGGVTESEFKVSFEAFNKQFIGDNWEVVTECADKAAKVKAVKSGFEGDLVIAEKISDKTAKAKRVAQHSLL